MYCCFGNLPLLHFSGGNTLFPSMDFIFKYNHALIFSFIEYECVACRCRIG